MSPYPGDGFVAQDLDVLVKFSDGNGDLLDQWSQLHALRAGQTSRHGSDLDLVGFVVPAGSLR